jgi:CDP-paratose 2-epimerase
VSRALVTGGAGFIGSNLADRLATEGHEVVIYDGLLRAGVERNLAWLQQRHGESIMPIIADIRDESKVAAALPGCDVVFHLAGQVAVTTSLQTPIEDFETNLLATVSLLDLLRRSGGRTPLIFASTNKVYGNLTDIPMEKTGECWRPRDTHLAETGVDEMRKLDFHTPYGCSKGAADQYVLDYARSFGVPTCVLRMSCIYGPRQMGTEDQGWVAHFLIRALKGEVLSIYGDGCQVRDILDVDDAVDAYMSAWENIERVSGRAFNLGGGPSNAISLRQLITHIETLTGRGIDLDFSDWRAGDQHYFVSDTSAIRSQLGLNTPRDWRQGVARLAEWLQTEHVSSRATAAV